ncbi:MAG: Error-prone repair protein ImuA [Chitinophagaceae bacterium]
MDANKTDIIHQLQKEILSIQGFRPGPPCNELDLGLGVINHSFPNDTFPLGAVHEFLCAGAEDAAATGGFIAGLLADLMRSGGASVWISSVRNIFPPALKFFGIEPHRIIFVDMQQEKDVLWAIEEALKCEGLAAVIGELQEISFTGSRRLQIAVEQSRVTGFLIRNHPRKLQSIACVSRWKIRPLPSKLDNGMPGIGFPRWTVDLLKARNGKPGTWQVEWAAGQFRHITSRPMSMPQEQNKKTG